MAEVPIAATLSCIILGKAFRRPVRPEPENSENWKRDGIGKEAGRRERKTWKRTYKENETKAKAKAKRKITRRREGKKTKRMRKKRMREIRVNKMRMIKMRMSGKNEDEWEK